MIRLGLGPRLGRGAEGGGGFGDVRPSVSHLSAPRATPKGVGWRRKRRRRGPRVRRSAGGHPLATVLTHGRVLTMGRTEFLPSPAMRLRPS
jgi:hypothetical protein